MNFTLLFKWIIMAIRNRMSFTLVGDPGIGKTTVLQDVSKFLGYLLIEIHPAEWQTIDLKGFPCVIDGKPEFIPYGEMAKILTSGENIIVLFDDMLHGKPDVLKAIMQIFRGRLGENKIPDNVFICGATNDVKDAADVRGMIEPLKSSMVLINVEHNADASLTYAENNGWRDDVCAFLRFNPEFWHQPIPTKQLKKSPCPREWRRVNDSLNMLETEVESGFITSTERIQMLMSNVTGCVGEDAAKLFTAQLGVMEKLPHPMEALANSKNVTLPDFNTEQSVLYMLVVSVSRIFEKEEHQNPINRDNAWALVDRIPQIFQRLMIQKLYTYDDAFKTMPQANGYRVLMQGDVTSI